jgi:hypothetical protein
MNARQRNVYVPTPEELRQHCHAIQSQWTAAERNKRSVIRNRRWTPPVVLAADLGLSNEPRGRRDS